MSDIIYRGTLTKEKLKELAHIYFGLVGDDHIFNPAKNHEVISITKQKDGNFIGSMWKNEQVITAREISPEIVLLKLITHE